MVLFLTKQFTGWEDFQEISGQSRRAISEDSGHSNPITTVFKLLYAEECVFMGKLTAHGEFMY